MFVFSLEDTLHAFVHLECVSKGNGLSVISKLCLGIFMSGGAPLSKLGGEGGRGVITQHQ